MGKWVLLRTADELNEKVQQLKRKSIKRVLTNYFLSDEQINDEIESTEFFYREEDENLIIIKRWDDFYQMYYFIGNLDVYSMDIPKSVNYGTLICELIEKESKEKQERVVKKFNSFGLANYKKYFLWEYKIEEVVVVNDKGLVFKEESNYDVLAEIYMIFDRYCDRLPQLRDFKNFCDGMGKLLCWDGDEYVGAVIYSVNKNVATEEFIYVTESARGKGYAKVLQNKFISHCIHALHLKRIYAWIEINNTKSVSLHQSAGYLRTDQYKLTLKREPFECKEV